MADARMPEEFFEELEPHLPPEKVVGPHGGRPAISHRVVMKVIWFILVTGNRWQDVPLELGCSGRTAHRRLREWEAMGIWDRLHVHLLELLRKVGEFDPHIAIVDSVIVRAFGGGEETGPSPVDRRKKGTKHTLMVDGNGVPIAVRMAPANTSDQTQILPIVLEIPRVGGTSGRPKELPDTVYADRGYDSDDTRALLRWLGVEPYIAKRRTPHGSGLGKVRWVVERTFSWLKGFRRMRIRYDRLSIIQEAWNTLAAAAICFRMICHDCVS
jgi:transposase